MTTARKKAASKARKTAAPKPEVAPALPEPETVAAPEEEVTLLPVEEPQPVAAPPPPAPTVTRKHCVNCGAPAIYETNGKSTTANAYCQRDLPANVTPAMVEQYQRLSRQ